MSVRPWLMPTRRSLSALLLILLANPHPTILAETPAKSPVEGAQRRDALGDPLPSGAVARLGTLRFRHGYSGAIDFSPDRKLAATAGRDNAIHLWDTDTGVERRRFCGHQAYIREVRFSSNGKFLASSSDDETVFLWDTVAGKELHRFSAKGSGLAFSPDGKLLVAEGFGNDVRIWDLATGKERIRLASSDSFRVFSFSPDGKHLAVGGHSGRIELWDWAEGKWLRSFKPGHSQIHTLIFSANGEVLVSGGADPLVRFWSVAGGEELWHIKANGRSLAFAPDGATLALGTNKSIQLWSMKTRKEIRRWEARSSIVRFTEEGKYLLSYDRKETLRRWEATSGKEAPAPGRQRVPLGHQGNIAALDFAPDGKSIASMCMDGVLCIDEVWTNRQILRTKCYPLDYSSLWIYGIIPYPLFFSSDGKSILLVELREFRDTLEEALGDVPAWRFTVRLLDSRSGKELRRLQGGEGGLVTAARGTDGKLRVVKCASHTIKSLELVGGEVRELFRSFSEPLGSFVALSPDGRRILCVADGAPYRLCCRKDGAEKPLFETPLGESLHPLRRLVCSPDDRWLVLGMSGWGRGEFIRFIDNATGKVWEPSTGEAAPTQQRTEKSVLPQDVSVLAFSPAGNVLAIGRNNGGVVLWDLDANAPRQTFQGHNGCVRTLAFSPDGRLLASGGDDATVLIWDVAGRLREGGLSATRLTPAQLEAAWNDLTSTDASRAHRAVWQLASAPEQALPFLKQRLMPSAEDKKRIAHWIEELDAEEFKVRESAQRELAKLGRLPADALTRALRANLSAESRRRIEELLRTTARLQQESALRLMLRSARSVEVLEHLASPEAKAFLQALHQLEGDSRLRAEVNAALLRLSRRRTNPLR